VVSVAASVQKAGTVTLTGFAYRGVARVPTAYGYTLTMMKFTARSITLTGGVTLTARYHGLTLVTRDSSIHIAGNVVLYATELSGLALGIVPITLTPGNALSVLLELLGTVTPLVPLTLTNVTTVHPLLSSDSLRASSLLITVS